jgi:hypothetical protein
MRVRSATITLALTSLLPLASSFAADTKLVKAVSDHFELYTTDNEAAATAALNHFETVRGYLVGVTGGHDPFTAPVRIVGFKTPGEFSSHQPAGVSAGKAFSEANAERVTIALAGLKPEMYQYGEREYVKLLLDRTNPKMAYWLRLGLTELYCTLRLADSGHLVIGIAPTREFHVTTMPELDLRTFFALKEGGVTDKGAEDFYAQAPNSALKGKDSLGSIEANLTTDYQGIAWQLTHMLMFQDEYRPKFGAFVGAIAGGENTDAVVQRIYGKSVSGLTGDLAIYYKMPTHKSGGVNFQLPKPVTPQIGELSAADSAVILAQLKSGK